MKGEFVKNKIAIIVAGSVVGIFSVLLVFFGNPANMGFCIACFIRDIAGGLGLHRADVVQYVRPEVLGLVLGSFILASKNKEFSSRGGSSPFTRLILSIVVMIGALVFLGCPLRMVLRIAGGDLNAVVGLLGFLSGIYVGILFLNKGFNLKRSYTLTHMEGYLFPFVNLALLIILLAIPSILFFSESGPGASKAPIWISLVAGLIVGGLAQKSRLCTVGGARDTILFKDSHLLLGLAMILVFSLLGNLAFGYFHLGFEEQPIAHTDGLWNFLGMSLVGWGSVLLGGCPMRQLILSGEGNTDSVISVIGLMIGAAIAHNFGLASSPAGATLPGQIAVIVSIVILLVISWVNSEFLSKAKS